MHYYYQELYIKKWDEWTTISNHIGLFLYLYCHINESGQKLDDIYPYYSSFFALLQYLGYCEAEFVGQGDST